jgi:hypothetical protein
LGRYGVGRLIATAFLSILLGNLCATSQNLSDEGKPFAKLAELALRDGIDAHIPSQLSQKLGITPGNPKKVKVKQIAFQKDDKTVVAFNVSKRDQDDLVIFVKTDKDLMLYLTSPEGVLRKVVHSEKVTDEPTGVRITEIPLSVARDGFEKEKQCWLQVKADKKWPSSCGKTKQ